MLTTLLFFRIKYSENDLRFFCSVHETSTSLSRLPRGLTRAVKPAGSETGLFWVTVEPPPCSPEPNPPSRPLPRSPPSATLALPWGCVTLPGRGGEAGPAGCAGPPRRGTPGLVVTPLGGAGQVCLALLLLATDRPAEVA